MHTTGDSGSGPRALVAVVAVLLLLVPARAAAQAVSSFEELPLRVDVGDRVEIQDLSGARVDGRIVSLTGEAITVATGAAELRLTSDMVQAVAVRGYGLRRGTLIGTAVFAALGAVATCRSEDRDACAAIGSVRAAPIGAGIGLAVGSLLPARKPAYRRPDTPGTPNRPSPADAAEASLLEEVGAHVNLDDRISVTDEAGVVRRGRLIGLSASVLTMAVETGAARFTRDALRQVAVRRRPLRAALLTGAAAGAAFGALAACAAAEDRSECPDAWLIGAGVGAGAGLAVGALIQRTKVVWTQVKR